jgi:putative transposase
MAWSSAIAFEPYLRAMGITEVITAARSPWQNPYAERLIGSIRRERLDHVRHLQRAPLAPRFIELFSIPP